MNISIPGWDDVYQPSRDARAQAEQQRRQAELTMPIGAELASRLPPGDPAHMAWRYYTVNNTLPTDSPFEMTPAGLIRKGTTHAHENH